MSQEPAAKLPQTVFSLDRNGKIPNYNLHALRFLGLPPSGDADGYDFADLVPPPQRRQTQQSLRRWLRGEARQAFPHTLVCGDGRELSVLLEGEPVLRAGRACEMTVRVYSA